jgi:TonB-dependent starch-binding outer membrane protein SusC
MRIFLRVFSVLVAASPLSALAAQGQTGTIRGRVTEEASGRPVEGVTVAFGARGTQTRQDGSYVLGDAPAGTDSIRFRLIGFVGASRSVTVSGGQTVTVDMALTAQALNLAAVVVTGYGEQRAGNITGAVSQVSAENFNPGRVVSPEMLIQSKVPGVQVVDNNEPGGGLSLRIRGPTSVNASSDPLIVVDGVPVGTGSGGGLSAGRNPLNFINPNDIESITVLRDASAAAIYGANAANGVVLITTKSGGAGRPQFEYSGSASASSITRTPTMLNAEQFRAAVTQYAPQNVSQLGSANTNWFDLIGHTAYGQDQNLSVSGSSNTMNWRVSGGYLHQDGVIRGTTTERVSLGLNFQQLLFDDRLDVHAVQKGSRAIDNFTPGGVLSNAAQMGPTQPVMDPTTSTGFYDWPGNKLTSPDNPLAILDLATDRGTTFRSVGSVQLAYRTPFADALRAHINLNYDVTRADRQTFTPSALHSQKKSGQNGADYRANQSQTNTGLETYLSYSAPLTYVPGAIDLTAGYSYGQSHAEYPYYLATGLSTDLLGGNGVASARTTQNVEDIQESRLISFFGRANYNFQDKYLIGGSIRRDGSSRFGPSNAWGTFPSVSLGWRLSEEPFVKNLGTFSDLKLRASWAKTGNQAFANYQFFANYVLGDAQTQAQFGDTYVATLRPSAYDPNIRWEETKSTDVGLDFGIMNQRITGAIDWYNKKTNDLIFTVPVAAGTNLSNFLTTNIGSMKNNGLELSVSAAVLRGPKNGFSWTADFTAAHNTNKLVSINPVFGSNVQRQQILTGLVSGGVGTFIQVLQPGQAVNTFYVYKHRTDASGKPVFKEGAGADTAMYVDQNGDHTINQDDRVPYEQPAPKLMLGHSSYFTYRSFDFSTTLRAYYGNWVYNNVASNLGTYAEVGRDSPYNLHASVLKTGFKSPQYLSDYYVEDASFIRMDNVTLGYSLNLRGQRVRVFGTLQNAFTITDYTGVDPTAGLNGLDNNIYPRSRTFTAGLSARF